jgi:hypothetical protein
MAIESFGDAIRAHVVRGAKGWKDIEHYKAKA